MRKALARQHRCPRPRRIAPMSKHESRRADPAAVSSAAMRKRFASATRVFMDGGGVLLSDGWDLHTHPTWTLRAAASFGSRLVGGTIDDHA
jgi:hypothetical protein